jgi:hypothetical protein
MSSYQVLSLCTGQCGGHSEQQGRDEGLRHHRACGQGVRGPLAQDCQQRQQHRLAYHHVIVVVVFACVLLPHPPTQQPWHYCSCANCPLATAAVAAFDGGVHRPSISCCCLLAGCQPTSTSAHALASDWNIPSFQIEREMCRG